MEKSVHNHPAHNKVVENPIKMINCFSVMLNDNLNTPNHLAIKFFVQQRDNFLLS